MNDLKQTLENLAERIEPPTDGFAEHLRRYQERSQRRQRVVTGTLLALLVAAASIAGIEASRANAARLPSALHFSNAAKNSTAYPHCPAKTGEGVFDPTLSSSSGTPGTTVTVSGPLPVLDESGAYVGQTASQVIAYWNLDLDKWWTALKSPLSPTPAVAGSAVQLLGTQDVAGVCNYSFQVKIPSGVAPGTYPIQLLIESSESTGVSTAPMPPANIHVTES